jgi:hypothetical protein
MTAELPEAIKQRDLVFTSEPPGQAEHAFALLSGVDGMEVQRLDDPNCLRVTYSLLDYSLENLEQALEKQGFRLDDSTLNQIGRKLIYYREEVEYHNLSVRERPTKTREREVFIKAYENHLHGDHDDTPPELRDYK